MSLASRKFIEEPSSGAQNQAKSKKHVFLLAKMLTFISQYNHNFLNIILWNEKSVPDENFCGKPSKVRFPCQF